jgi:hypothetical protein
MISEGILRAESAVGYVQIRIESREKGSVVEAIELRP